MENMVVTTVIDKILSVTKTTRPIDAANGVPKDAITRRAPGYEPPTPCKAPIRVERLW